MFLIETKLGGGVEIMATVGIAFILAPREKFFYYLAALTIDKLFIGYFKLAYHKPRPYMIHDGIIPMTCSKAFGLPSGHSSASNMLPLVLFLDIFHGNTETVKSC